MTPDKDKLQSLLIHTHSSLLHGTSGTPFLHIAHSATPQYSTKGLLQIDEAHEQVVSHTTFLFPQLSKDKYSHRPSSPGIQQNLIWLIVTNLQMSSTKLISTCSFQTQHSSLPCQTHFKIHHKIHISFKTVATLWRSIQNKDPRHMLKH